MNFEEIQKAIKKHNLENDDYYNFSTRKSTYALYYLICIFEHKSMKTTRIINNKCETRIFKPGNSLDIHWYSVRNNYNDNLEYKNNKILEFEII